mmetsp:Transcript_21333/g.66987  ORF Transcript_21333/g.66987 Transcript_21333/m.66987 type:complete len:217 (+) Transcript_21333:165-815(+)
MRFILTAVVAVHSCDAFVSTPTTPRALARHRDVSRDALLNAPRKEDSWYEGLSTDPGAAGKVTDEAKAYAESIKTKVVTMDDVIDVIDANFAYTDVAFSVGKVQNDAGTNVKSSKILAYGYLTKMDTETVLKCYGSVYDDVKGDPNGDSHANIRALMAGGVEAVKFPNGLSLTPKLVDDDEEYTSEKGLAASSSIGAGDDWDVDSDIWIPVDGVEL